jgi:stage II sporulation protein D
VGRGEIPVYAPDIRQVFQTPEGRPLGSTAVQLHPEREGDRLVRLKAAGAGWGHGVGMCQWGAVGRARAGQDFRAIVAAYFPGTVIERWY